MTIYEYRCIDCGHHFDSTVRAQVHPEPCRNPIWIGRCGGELRRFYGSISVRRPFVEHYNPSVGTPVSSQAQFRSELARQSDAASQRLGYDVSYAAVDPREAKEFLGVTETGLESTYNRRRATGLPATPL